MVFWVVLKMVSKKIEITRKDILKELVWFEPIWIALLLGWIIGYFFGKVVGIMFFLIIILILGIRETIIWRDISKNIKIKW